MPKPYAERCTEDQVEKIRRWCEARRALGNQKSMAARLGVTQQQFWYQVRKMRGSK